LVRLKADTTYVHTHMRKTFLTIAALAALVVAVVAQKSPVVGVSTEMLSARA